MVQNSSLGTAFDFSSQAGIASILATVRSSDLGSEDKNEIRDLVFLYTNGGRDESVRIALEQKLATHNLEPAPVVSLKIKEPLPTPKFPFGSFRPAPSFVVPKVDLPIIAKVVQENNLKTEVKEEVNSTKSTPPVAKEPPVVLNEASKEEIKPVTSTSLDQVVSPMIQPESTPEPTPAPVELSDQTSKSKSESESESTKPKVADKEVVVSVDNNYLNRIREIKQVVNNKVGNPVNLIDIDNVAGREYMNALLDAMKKMSGGVAGELDMAMTRLETAFSFVLEAIEKHQNSIDKTKEPALPTESSKLDNKQEKSIEMVEVSKTESPLPPTPIGVANTEKNESKSGFENIMDSDVFNLVEEPKLAISIAETQKKQPQAVADTNFPSIDNNSKITSLAEEKKILTISDIPDVLPKTQEEIGNPLFARDIEDGLDQLLSDWVLFKKSGLFGTGPKGKEHPLYKKIASLQIPILLAGRFEGATPEIRQSITDYMNGWRYEQGIIYEQGETFELYLRRVIRHILDLQKKRNPVII